MGKKKRSIRKRDPRVLLSDVLPYELPPSFNNRGLYDFMNDVNLRIEGKEIRARNLDASTPILLSILLGRAVEFPPGTPLRTDAVLQGLKPEIVTIPFQFNVRHRVNDSRTLTVPHPAAQLEIVEFYRRNADLMLYHTSRSSYSLRHPSAVARYSVVRDWLFEKDLRASDSIEIESNEYEWLRSYFTYKRYSNVYKFYDSPEYRACERKYGYLVKADVAKCFDSIYTHSIAWATHGHAMVKENLGKPLKGTFGDDFDLLMQRLNHNETSGITIGSEVSRIFAEIILQAVDRDIHKQLSQDGLVHGSDYEILRYVDDYFIFLANPQKRLGVLEQIARSLRAYKLHLNSAKEEGEHTPWLSPLTVAKEHTTRLVRKGVDAGEPDDDSGKLPSPYVRAERLIVGYKSVLLDTGVSHFDLANFALARSERAVEKLIKRSMESVTAHPDVDVAERHRHAHAMAGALVALLDFVFFAYSGAPRMSPAVKVARVTSTVLRFSRLDYVPLHERERLELRIREELLTQLVRARRSESPSAVTASLLDCLSDLGPYYSLNEIELADVFSFERTDSGDLVPPRNFNAVLLFSILMHIRDVGGYDSLRASCIKWSLDIQSRSAVDGERSIVSLNLLSCPYLDDATKSSILSAYGITGATQRAAVKASSPAWNINWDGFDLYAALQQKRLYEVY